MLVFFLQVLNFVPQQQAWIVERFGRYLKTLDPVSDMVFITVTRVSYRIFGLGGGNSLYINKVRDCGHSSPRKKLRFGLTIDFSISNINILKLLGGGGGGGNPSFPPPCMNPW